MATGPSLASLIEYSEREIEAWSGMSHSITLREQTRHLSYAQHRSNRPQRQKPRLKASLPPLDPNAPPIPARAPGHSLPPVDYRARLKRKPSPQFQSLREIRVKESEAALRSAYESGVTAYLNDDMDMQRPARHSKVGSWSSGSDLSSGAESIKEEPESEEEMESHFCVKSNTQLTRSSGQDCYSLSSWTSHVRF